MPRRQRPLSDRRRWPLPPRIATSPFATKAVLTALAMLMTLAAISFHLALQTGRNAIFADFHAFYVAGSLALEGRAGDAYHMATMEQAQHLFTRVDDFMPWTYPPPYTLLVTALAALPLGLAYALFMALTLTAYVLVLRRIAGDHLPGVLIAMLPVMTLTVMTGQNGFLTGALTGWFLLSFVARRPQAGWPLGLMILKPHLAAAIALLALVERRWQAMAIAAAVVVTALLVPTWVFGTGIWNAFLDGVAESGEFLTQGHYPLFRMTSLYAAMLSAGLPAATAFAVQAAGALLAMGLLLFGWRRGLPPRWLAASACAASVFVSPYNYDYDLGILGVGLAFVLPDLLQRTRVAEQCALLGLCWTGIGYGLITAFVADPAMVGTGGKPLSLMAAPLMLLIAWVAIALRRAPLAEVTSAVSAQRPEWSVTRY